MNIYDLINVYTTRAFVLSKIAKLNNLQILIVMKDMKLDSKQYAHFDAIDDCQEALVSTIDTFNLYNIAEAAFKLEYRPSEIK